MPRASIVAETLLLDQGIAWFDRWFDALIQALGTAAALGEVDRWRIFVNDAAAPQSLDSTSIAGYKRRAATAGGEFDCSGEDNNRTQGELVLVLRPGAIVLATTVVRLLHALGGDTHTLSARQIPLAKSFGSDSACLLTSEGASRNGSFAANECPEAVAHLDVRKSWPEGSVAVAVDGSGGSLLELAMNATQLGAAREQVQFALNDAGEPLMSIVMRTQGHRPEALRDTLLCLAGQSDGRFELLLVIHDGIAEGVLRVLEDQPEWLRSRTRLLVAEGGTRSHPLNVGIAVARGSHVAFLDDDDLVFSHWVESFLAVAESNPRRLLRASAGVQWVRAATWSGGIEGHLSEPEIATPYPVSFDLAEHLGVNMTPFMVFAFPRAFFTVFGGADETLEVCEDWDLALRAATVLGVGAVSELTAIYRRWRTGRDSYSAHDALKWERDMARVLAKLDEGPLILPAGSASQLAQFSAARNSQADLAEVYASSSWRLTAPIRAIVTSLKRVRRADNQSSGHAER